MVSKIISFLTALLEWLEARETQRNPRRLQQLEDEIAKIKKQIVNLEWGGDPRKRGALRLLRFRLSDLTRQLGNLPTGNPTPKERNED